MNTNTSKAKKSMTIHIYQGGNWAGTGTVRDDGTIECAALLGGTQESSDQIYGEIEDAIDYGDTEGSVHAGEGQDNYHWELS